MKYSRKYFIQTFWVDIKGDVKYIKVLIKKLILILYINNEIRDSDEIIEFIFSIFTITPNIPLFL